MNNACFGLTDTSTETPRGASDLAEDENTPLKTTTREPAESVTPESDNLTTPNNLPGK